jgi:hypothetical protein
MIIIMMIMYSKNESAARRLEHIHLGFNENHIQQLRAREHDVACDLWDLASPEIPHRTLPAATTITLPSY